MIAGGFDEVRPADAHPFTHAGAFTQHGGYELVACVDPDRTRAEAFGRRWHVAHAYSFAEALLAHAGAIDVVAIASPTEHHEEHVHLALELGTRGIFCEKPLAPTLGAAESMVEACERVGVKLAVNHTRRWAPDVVRLADDLVHSRYGPVRSASGLYNKGVLNNGSHMIDLVHLLLGEVTVAWSGLAVSDHRPDDPTVPFTLETLGGIPVQINVGHAADMALFELQIVTAMAAISMEDGGARWRVRHSRDNPNFRGYKSLADGELINGEYHLAMSAAIANLHDAITDGHALASTGRTALAAQELCETIRKASQADMAPRQDGRLE